MKELEKKLQIELEKKRFKDFSLSEIDKSFSWKHKIGPGRKTKTIEGSNQKI